MQANVQVMETEIRAENCLILLKSLHIYNYICIYIIYTIVSIIRGCGNHVVVQLQGLVGIASQTSVLGCTGEDALLELSLAWVQIMVP